VYHAAALDADGFQMNWKNGFVRLWIAVSLLWMVYPAYLMDDAMEQAKSKHERYISWNSRVAA
jgi:hypothetical protein